MIRFRPNVVAQFVPDPGEEHQEHGQLQDDELDLDDAVAERCQRVGCRGTANLFPDLKETRRGSQASVRPNLETAESEGRLLLGRQAL